MGFIDDEGEKMDIIREDDHSTSPKQWTEVEDEKLIKLYEKHDRDIVKISKEMKREERSGLMKLFFLNMISKDDVVWRDKRSVGMSLLFMDLIKESDVDQRF